MAIVVLHSISLLWQRYGTLGDMARPSDPRIRADLVTHAAAMLAADETLTLRAVTERAGTSTMAVYTHFGGMPGLLRAVRLEGFRLLVARIDDLSPTDDPVHDLAAVCAAYVAHGLAHPHLYRAMFDTTTGLDPDGTAEAGIGLSRLVDASRRAVGAGRFAAGTDPGAVATRLWVTGHGLLDLVLRGVLPGDAVDAHGASLVRATCLDAGDEPEKCEMSVSGGWGSAAGGPR
jgi:AcrR family transcriptional regulator